MRNRHHIVLAVAADGEDRSQRDFSELLDIDPSAIVALVDDLERDGLVSRAPHPTDRRLRVIVATDKGRERLRETKKISGELSDALLDGLSEEERVTLRVLLQRITSL